MIHSAGVYHSLEAFMNRLVKFLAPVALAAGIGGILNADDSMPPPSGGPTATEAWQASDGYIWGVEHAAEIAKDADSTGVQAVIEADHLLKSRDPQVALDFFNKALYDTKSRAVQREIRFVLYRLYEQTGQHDKALDQLQQLIVEP
jgi:hypothetical protein